MKAIVIQISLVMVSSVHVLRTLLYL